MSDAVQLLKEQHTEVKALFKQIERVTDPVLRTQIFRTIDTNLRIHATIEEKIFYPAFRERAKNRTQSEEVSEALHEHDMVKSVLQELERTDASSESFKTKLASLKMLVEQHVHEEEHGMLKEARRLFSAVELQDLALRMEHAAVQASPVYEMTGPPMR
jgi:hemerythrin-like domain-containing protein